MSRFSYLLLGLFLFVLLHLPLEWTDFWRSKAVASLSSSWRNVVPAARTKASAQSGDTSLLQEQVLALQEWLTEEKRLQEISSRCAVLLQISDSHLKNDLFRRVQRQKKILALRFAAMPAPIIFRDPSSWSSVLWVGLGEEDNRAIGRTVIARNSPVLAGEALIGVVEYVGQAQSRIRLITDAGLAVAVRVLRGDGQNGELSTHVQNVLERVRVRSDLFSSVEEQERFIELLSAFQLRLEPAAQEELLAKGEICGCSAPLWRSRGTCLKGVGFNYDYADEEGPARDLRSGRPFHLHTAPATTLICEGDLLVTSGLDGVFPPGIPVAIATKVEFLKEGSSTYDLEGKPAAGELQDLRSVLVLPPLGGPNQRLSEIF